MRYPFITLLTLLSLNGIAQKAAQQANYAIIKGHIQNHTEDNWDYSVQDYLKFETISVPVNKNGDFFKKIQLDSTGKDVSILQGNGVMVKLQKNDTIEVNYDEKDLQKTLSVTSPATAKNNELKTSALLINNFVSSYDQIMSLYQKKLTDSAKFAVINDLYNKQVEILLTAETNANTLNTATDIYFRYTSMLFRQNLLPRYELFIIHPTEKSFGIPLLTQPKAYAIESIEYYRKSSEYRDFIFNYVRFFKPLNRWDVPAGTSSVPPQSWAWKEYYAGLANFNTAEIRDWYLTKAIMFDFEISDFNEASDICRDFMTKVKTPYYADTLRKFYANIQRLKPGMPAPGFTLKDENGRMVSLAQFKGKTVYIDFWGVGCGPCIYDIKNHVPALHEKYKDKNLVFINICVDSDESTWKESLKKLNLHGINLIATGWTKHPTVKAYNVNGIPHYYIIDANGKIADNNSPGPSQGEALSAKLDALLK
jgi:peroxiredoxin